MVLYVAIVLLAMLTALPTADDETGGGDWLHGSALVAAVWGSALGLAIAHLFAFRLAARIFGAGDVREVDVAIGIAQILGAALVAALCTVPIVLADDDSDVEAATFVPALLVGVAGYAVGRVSGRSQIRALIVGIGIALLGLLVATVKNLLLHH